MTGAAPQRDGDLAPIEAKDAVFVASHPVPQGLRVVQGIDFNRRHNGDISVVDLVEGMSDMGFQASAISDAVQIINEMVRRLLLSGPVVEQVISDCPCRGHGRTMTPATEPRSFLATRRI